MNEETLNTAFQMLSSLVKMGPFGKITLAVVLLGLAVLTWKFKSQILLFLRAMAEKARQLAFEEQQQKSAQNNAKTEQKATQSQNELIRREDKELQLMLEELPFPDLLEVAYAAYGADIVKTIILNLDEVGARLAIYKLYGIKKV